MPVVVVKYQIDSTLKRKILTLMALASVDGFSTG